MTPNLATFYAPERRGRAFGVWARDYTIALAPSGGGYHIGQDYTTGRQPLEVPAILAGTVVRVRLAEGVLGSIVVIRCTWLGQTIYVQYSHLSKERLPVVGDWINQGGRVGRLAAGPNARTATRNNPAVSISDIEWPGTGWDGIHLHLVISRHPEAGYSKVAGYRTLSAFLDPVPIIAAILASAASGGSRPFDPEEDDMAFDDDDKRKLDYLYSTLTPGIPNVKHAGAAYNAVIEARDNAKAGYALLQTVAQTAERARAAAQTASDSVTPGIEGVKWDGLLYSLVKHGSGAVVDEKAVAAELAPVLAPLLADNLGTLSDAAVDSLVDRLLDEQAKRLAS